jgi:DNA ligase-1
MKPMLLYQKNPDIYVDVPYPCIAMPKLDGIRCLTTKYGPVSRTLKLIPSDHVRKQLQHLPEGFDGELIVGDPTAADVYRNTNSHVMAHDKVFDFTYYVFDMWGEDNTVYHERLNNVIDLVPRLKNKHVVALKGEIINDPIALAKYEAKCIDEGYEGISIRSRKGMYKYGRTTLKEANAFKLKRFEDSEAYVVDMVPEYENTNEAKRGATGKIERSTAKEGLVAKERMGALLVRDRVTDVEFHIGTGFTAEEREWWYHHWDEEYIITYKFFPVGVKEKPRHPVYKGIRSQGDYS